MKIPRDLSGAELAKALRTLGYERVRQDGSHLRLTTQRGGEHHVTVPSHNPIKLGTLSGILKAVASHNKLTVEEVARQIGL